MGAADFPAWYSAGIFGGIGCALLSAIAIATWSLWRRRGVTGRVIGALLACVIASALDIGPLLWIEYRLNVYGPTLSVAEVGGALAAAALVGWAAPLAAMCWCVLLATPAPLAAGAPAVARAARAGLVSPAALDDIGRTLAVNADGQPWGLLTPVDSPPDETLPRPITLTHRLTLIGRELDNDIVLDDERVSRRHAELRWDRGRVELADYGSLNGTLINQQAARGWRILRDGDLIDLGKRRYQFSAPATQLAQARGAESESMETRKTPSAHDAVARSRPLLQLALLQGAENSRGAAWPLSAPMISIGRDPSCDITLADSSISRTHAQVTRQPAGYFIADLQSSNGARLNGQRLEGPAQIFAGDIIALGDCLLRCEELAAANASISPAHDMSHATADQSAPQTPQTASRLPTGTPSFHMRIAPRWAGRKDSRPRLAPPRLAPTSSHPDIPSNKAGG